MVEMWVGSMDGSMDVMKAESMDATMVEMMAGSMDLMKVGL